MLTRIRKWGNSQGMRFAKSVLEEAHVKVGDQVRVSVQHGRIIVEPVADVRGRYELKALVSRMPKECSVEEIDWGPPAGKETW